MKATRRRAMPYLKLVKAFPLRPLRSDAEQEKAVQVLSRLVGRPDGKLSDGESDYADALAIIIRDYDAREHPFPSAEMTPVEAVRYLMEQSGMNVAGLGEVMGNQTAASLFLHGKRELSKNHIRRLTERFKVSPALFL